MLATVVAMYNRVGPLASPAFFRRREGCDARSYAAAAAMTSHSQTERTSCTTLRGGRPLERGGHAYGEDASCAQVNPGAYRESTPDSNQRVRDRTANPLKRLLALSGRSRSVAELS